MGKPSLKFAVMVKTIGPRIPLSQVRSPVDFSEIFFFASFSEHHLYFHAIRVLHDISTCGDRRCERLSG